MGTYIRGSGRTIRRMGRGPIDSNQVLNMRDNGRMMCIMAGVHFGMQMEIDLRDNLTMDRRLIKGYNKLCIYVRHISIRMDQNIRVNGLGRREVGMGR